MVDYFDEHGVVNKTKVINAVKDIDKKRMEETDKDKVTQLMMEQMLRGLYLQIEDSKF